MTISEALATQILADAGVATLMADRLFPERVLADDQMPAVPYAVYHIEEKRAEESTDSIVALMEVSLQVTAVSNDYDEAFQLAHAILPVLEFFKGLMGGPSGVGVEMCALDGIEGGYIAEFDLFTANSKFTLQYVTQ